MFLLNNFIIWEYFIFILQKNLYFIYILFYIIYILIHIIYILYYKEYFFREMASMFSLNTLYIPIVTSSLLSDLDLDLEKKKTRWINKIG